MPPSLASLHALCKANIHNGSLSLRQLKLVHQTLLESSFSEAKRDAKSWKSIQSPSSLSPIIDAICGEEDGSVCREIIESGSEDCERLFVVQFLKLHLNFGDFIRCVLVPYLVEKNDFSEDLVVTLLDLLEEDSDISSDAIDALKVPHPITGRIAVTLLKQRGDYVPLIEVFHEKVLYALKEAMHSPEQSTPMISTLSKDLLPVLTESSDDGTPTVLSSLHRPLINDLWKTMFAVEFSPSKELRQTLLVVTTILCPLLPYLVNCEVPKIGGDAGLQEPASEPQLWFLVYTCFEQGKSLLDGDTASSSVLRKRALYLLNIIASSDSWKKFCMCAETLEMETEQHLIDQIWDTVDELIAKIEEPHETGQYTELSWRWMSLLYSRALSTDQTTVRKLGLYRLLKVPSENEAAEASKKRAGKKKSHQIIVRKSSIRRSMLGMTPEFVLRTLLPSWNSLRTSVGYNVHLGTSSKKVDKEDMIPLMTDWLQDYIDTLDAINAKAFWSGIWSWSLIKNFHIKNIVTIYESLAKKLSTSTLVVPADNEALLSLSETMLSQFADGACVVTYQKRLLLALATMLSHCTSSDDRSQKYAPMTMLKILALFSVDYFSLDTEDWKIEDEELLTALKTWILQLDADITTVGAAVASAFVRGDLMNVKESWDPTFGSTTEERELGWAITLLCTLAAKNSKSSTTGQLLWPAINKGLSSTSEAILTKGHVKARDVSRALILLEYGCRLREISGTGNGDLVVDSTTQQLMPPPANIEKLLSFAVDFISHHLRVLLSAEALCDPSEPIKPKRVLSTCISLVSQMRVLNQSYMSSNVIPNAVNDSFATSHKELNQTSGNDIQRSMLCASIYAALSTGVDPGHNEYISLCRLLLSQELTEGATGEWTYIAQAIMQYAKWASISCILPLLQASMENASSETCEEAQALLHDILEAAFAAAPRTATYACLPLFNSILLASKNWVNNRAAESEEAEKLYVEKLKRIVDALLALMKKSHTSQETMDMLNETCAFIFHPKLLNEEESRIQKSARCPTPVRDAFRKLVKMAGTMRSHILKAALCRITVSWLGTDETRLGQNAIPYREDIVKLLLHKEQKIEESAKNQSMVTNTDGVMTIPAATNELSVGRAFILVFLSKLPSVDNGLDKRVLHELLHPIILELLKETAPTKSSAKNLIMKGTTAYCLKMRGWQALCNLSRFVTEEIASEVSQKVYGMMPEHIHGQVRYFIEIFTIQCAKSHPYVFGSTFLKEISRRDLTLQHVSSLMIIAGNWVVGRYKIDYFDLKHENRQRLQELLAAIIPWLSSTQGFSRAIAQLLVHKLTPLCVDVSNMESITTSDEDWFPRLIYRFLDENREMQRLRKKQGGFFERYSVEEMCTPEGVLGIPVDEGDEADPLHLVDAMKDILKNIYSEAHADDAPAWKQIENIVKAEQSTEGENDTEVNFQRKIIPLDSLNLAMEDVRQKRIRNTVGNPKQQLIVCASLVDKVPNLGGLARTSEIFAADRLVVPDISVTKMDNFKSLSVGAGEWIDIEEVKEEDLLSWLLAKKSKGYFVFGLEQTSSSMSLTDMKFPDQPTVLLLGKEKEGIPVEYLQAVDQCVEIPQMGVIRSLNVHVSGALAIWEHTKQRKLKS
ncbi:unnamed protein product [Cylindrotheca closterium]|uniref:tRNA/rRNA methyltransferase SpoU type domain-containing protein n=1 Tax=Cylindrotheca closterium TaxID=2856 RepID=A0AAD2G6X9_9STRA|nr:unnamed protein product [Cylindrotheca closterium]